MLTKILLLKNYNLWQCEQTHTNIKKNSKHLFKKKPHTSLDFVFRCYSRIIAVSENFENFLQKSFFDFKSNTGTYKLHEKAKSKLSGSLSSFISRSIGTESEFQRIT